MNLRMKRLIVISSILVFTSVPNTVTTQAAQTPSYRNDHAREHSVQTAYFLCPLLSIVHCPPIARPHRPGASA